MRSSAAKDCKSSSLSGPAFGPLMRRAGAAAAGAYGSLVQLIRASQALRRFQNRGKGSFLLFGAVECGSASGDDEAIGLLTSRSCATLVRETRVGQTMTKQLFAFVLMPFSSEFSDVYHLGIKQAVEDAGMLAERVDEQVFHAERMLERIYNQIDSCDFIIADMTGRNANVFYEVGYAHAKGKRCILLTNNADDIPFDLKHHRHIVYDDIVSLKSRLFKDISTIETELTSPIEAALHSTKGVLELTKYRADANVTFAFDITNPSSAVSPDIDHVYIYTGQSWRLSQDGRECASSKSDIDGFALRHQLSFPVSRIQKGGWTRLTATGMKVLAWALNGEKLEEKYPLKGNVLLSFLTARGEHRFKFPVSMEIDEIPF